MYAAASRHGPSRLICWTLPPAAFQRPRQHLGPLPRAGGVVWQPWRRRRPPLSGWRRLRLATLLPRSLLRGPSRQRCRVARLTFPQPPIPPRRRPLADPLSSPRLRRVDRCTYRRRMSFRTKSNTVRKVKTPGGKLVLHYTGKKGKTLSCGEAGCAKRLDGVRLSHCRTCSCGPSVWSGLRRVVGDGRRRAGDRDTNRLLNAVPVQPWGCAAARRAAAAAAAAAVAGVSSPLSLPACVADPRAAPG